ncbi:MAG: thioredoxin family protein [Bdellovibrionales bacterium]|nr:thioredoxin family protein [Bdellovibrionales bacterium]
MFRNLKRLFSLCFLVLLLSNTVKAEIDGLYFNNGKVKDCEANGGLRFSKCSSEKNLEMFIMAIEEARAKNKILMVLFGHVKCPYCKKLDMALENDQSFKETFSDKLLILNVNASGFHKGELKFANLIEQKIIEFDEYFVVDSTPSAVLIKPTTNQDFLIPLKPKEVEEEFTSRYKFNPAILIEGNVKDKSLNLRKLSNILKKILKVTDSLS